MTTVEMFRFPPANLLDQSGHALATGEAYIDTESNLAEFFPARKTDAENLLKRAAILQMTGGATYVVRSIKRCPAIRLGRANPHYDLTIEPRPTQALQ